MLCKQLFVLFSGHDSSSFMYNKTYVKLLDFHYNLLHIKLRNHEERFLRPEHFEAYPDSATDAKE